MKKYLIAIFVLSTALSAYSQEGTSLWTGVSLEKKINKKIELSLGAQIRMPENISYTQSYLGELGVTYKLMKNLDITGYYRFINKRKDETKLWKNRHRFYVDLAYDKKIGVIKFENRLRYQHQFKDNDGEVGFDSSYLRNKIELSYPNKTKLTPYISGDLFYEIGNTINQLRPAVGVNYKLNKKNALQFGLMQNIDLVDGNNSGAILRVGYKLKL